jgi:hypothetical protein
MKKIILMKAFLGGLLAVSNLAIAQQNLQDKSSIELQAVQTRTYQKPYKEVFRAVVTVLQDNKYKVSFTDMNAGLITASGSPQLTENMHQGVAFIPFIGGLLSLAREEKSEIWTVSSTVEDLEKNRGVIVRLTITSDKTKSSLMSSASDKATTEDLTSKPEIYQDLFAKIDKALFIRDATR